MANFISPFSRRRLIKQVTAGAVGITAASTLAMHAQQSQADEQAKPARKGRIKQTMCLWCMGGDRHIVNRAKLCQKLGIVGMDLIKPALWPVLKEHGLVCSMTPSHNIGQGVNNPKFADNCVKKIEAAIIATAEAGYQNVICFSGNRNQGINDTEGLVNSAKTLKRVIKLAEKHNVVLQMELLNSKNHKHYMCDSTAWGVELVKRVGSDHFRLLYDIFHMQRMEGDIIDTIRKNHQYIGHYHTAGNPGRGPLTPDQELQYPPIIKAIIKTGYKGFLGQEFYAGRDVEKTLTQAVTLCDV